MLLYAYASKVTRYWRVAIDITSGDFQSTQTIMRRSRTYTPPRLTDWGGIEDLTGVGQTHPGGDFNMGSVIPPGHQNGGAPGNGNGPGNGGGAGNGNGPGNGFGGPPPWAEIGRAHV